MTTPMNACPMTDMAFFRRTSPPWAKPAAGVCSMTKVVAQSILKSGCDAVRDVDELANVWMPVKLQRDSKQGQGCRDCRLPCKPCCDTTVMWKMWGPVTTGGAHPPCDVTSVEVGLGSPADVRVGLVTGVPGVEAR